MEVQTEVIKPGQNVVIVDDLLATGGQFIIKDFLVSGGGAFFVVITVVGWLAIICTNWCRRTHVCGVCMHTCMSVYMRYAVSL